MILGVTLGPTNTQYYNPIFWRQQESLSPLLLRTQSNSGPLGLQLSLTLLTAPYSNKVHVMWQLSSPHNCLHSTVFKAIQSLSKHWGDDFRPVLGCVSYILNTPRLPMLLNTIHRVPAGNLLTHYTICPTLMALSVIFEKGLLKLFINMLNFLSFIPQNLENTLCILSFLSMKILQLVLGVHSCNPCS